MAPLALVQARDLTTTMRSTKGGTKGTKGTQGPPSKGQMKLSPLKVRLATPTLRLVKRTPDPSSPPSRSPARRSQPLTATRCLLPAPRRRLI